MYTAIVIDDEPKIREVLKIKIAEFCPDIKILGEGVDVESGYLKIVELKPQLVFLDISMPGASGFKLLDRFEKIDFEIIFVTGYNEFALDALKVSAVDYMLKPVKTDELIQAIDKAKVRIDSKTKAQEYEVLKYNVNHIGDQETKIAISSAEAYEIVRISDIVRCEGWNKYTKIHLEDGVVLISSNNIGGFREKLEPYDFFASHKSHLVNKKKIKRYLKEGTIVMEDGSMVPLARRRKDNFIENELKSIVNN